MTSQRMEHSDVAPPTTLVATIGATDTSFTLASGTGYPVGVHPFLLVLDPGQTAEEKVLCQARSGASVTVAPSGRGYAGTTASSHTGGTAVIQHVMGAFEIDDANDHIYTTTRDDHTQYARTDGTRTISGNQTFGAGLTVSAGTTAVQALTATSVTATTVTGSSTVTAPAVAGTATGTTGRYVGSTNGAPVSGTYNTGDFADDPTNAVFWQCTAGGTPGTWVQIGNGLTDAAWTAPTLTNSWANIGSGNTPAGYRKVNGRVYLRGLLISGGSGTSCFTLASGYRPAYTLNPSCNLDIAGSNFAIYILIGTDGTIKPSWLGSPSPTSVCLDNISFDTLA